MSAVCIVLPARPIDNNGNWRTAERWKAHLDAVADVEVRQEWDGEPADVLVALHARRSAASIDRFHRMFPARPIVLVLTGTDVYRDIAVDADAQRALARASCLVGLQPCALEMLDAQALTKAQVIVQGAEAIAHAPAANGAATFVAVGHLRDEKDPVTLMRAVRQLPTHVRVLHIGAGLDEALAQEARALMHEAPNYQWAGALPHAQVRQHIAAATALVHMSRLEGGANVVIEAIVSGTPVLASRIGGNVGLLGAGYGGYFPVGDDRALAALMRRGVDDPAFVAMLAAQCAALAPRYTLAAECRAVRALLRSLSPR